MAKQINRLTARKVASLIQPGIHADGAGLYLRVRSPSSRSWFFIWSENGKRREMGLGSVDRVELAVARSLARNANEIIANGGDPVAAKRAGRKVDTFGDIADEFIKNRTPSVRSDKSVARWKRAIGEKGYSSALRPLSVDKITTADVLGVLEPIWSTKPKTASDLRGYVEQILSAAKAKGLYHGDNPARWRGHLEKLLPKPDKLSRGHHKAMEYSKVPEFVEVLRTRKSMAARALEFVILCASRSGEVRGATWQEFDLTNNIWTVPASRMKARKEQRVPLSKPAVQLLADLGKGEAGDMVFPGEKGAPLSNMAMSMLLRRIEKAATVHGMRSSFRDWAGDETEYPRDLVEAALAHSVGDAAERAYRRKDALERRRSLMEDWGAYCAAPRSTEERE